MENKTPEFVITGGPCAGKTTGFSYISEKLMDRGWRVFITPEIPTVFIGGGLQDIMEIARSDFAKYIEIERRMLLANIAVNREFDELIRLFPGEKCVKFRDRAEMDQKAYLPAGIFEALLEEERLNYYDVRDRYDAVIHLVTAANGAESFYTLDNNKARLEVSLADAIRADELTLKAWIGHQHLRVIDNSTDFEGKMRRTLQSVFRVLGLPVPIEIERKFLLKRRPDLRFSELREAVRVSIEQMYLLTSDGSESRIRKRSQWNHSTHYQTRKTSIPGKASVRHETEKIITPTEYIGLQRLRDLSAQVVRKSRYCFVYKNQHFELDEFIEPKKLWLLEIELTEENDKIDLPPFLDIEREVTGEEKYSNYAIARGL